MSNISVLPEDIVIKIAAGEIIERPASIVKELIENSIDANASHIKVGILKGGKQLIKVEDNGSGMDQKNLALSIKRYATSKLKTFSDLNSIRTFGFRGEALPSIASVTKTSIASCKNNSVGKKIYVEGSSIKKTIDYAMPQGTIIEVRDLFFNTPARLKFFKTDSTELSHISKCITQEAIAHPSIYFTFTNEGKKLMDIPGSNDPLYRLSCLLGKDISKNLIPISDNNEYLKITGFITQPAYTRSTNSHLYLYINNRYISNRTLLHSILNGYQGAIPSGKYPAAILMIEMDPSLFDVNVHPRKTDVRFKEERVVYKIISDRVREHLIRFKTIHHIPSSLQNNNISDYNRSRYSQDHYYIKKDTTDAFIKEDICQYEHQKDLFQRDDPLLHTNPPKTRDETETLYDLVDLKLLGQLHNTYIILEGKNGLILIDQHAAHERIIYNRLKESHNPESIDVQHLLLPEKINLAPAESILFEKLIPTLKNLGIVIEIFGKNTFLIRSVPSFLKKNQHSDLIFELLEDPAIKDNNTAVIDKIISTIACHSAIRSGKSLNEEEIKVLLTDLAVVNLSHSCPHGRPSIISLSRDELDKRFKRK